MTYTHTVEHRHRRLMHDTHTVEHRHKRLIYDTNTHKQRSTDTGGGYMTQTHTHSGAQTQEADT